MYAIKRYRVRYSLKGCSSRVFEVAINAPSMQYIRSNWYAICGGRPFVIQKITLTR